MLWSTDGMTDNPFSDAEPFWVSKTERWIYDGYVDLMFTRDDNDGELSIRLGEREAEQLREILNEFLN